MWEYTICQYIYILVLLILYYYYYRKLLPLLELRQRMGHRVGVREVRRLGQRGAYSVECIFFSYA